MDVPITCPCPPKGESVRHPKGDTVVLRDTLPYREAMTVRNTVRILRLEGANVAQGLAGITEAYLLVGIESWTLEDEEGKPRPVDNASIHEHLLSHLDQAITVSDAADELYQSSVMLPLVNRDYGSLLPTPTPSEDDHPSTSATPETGPKSPPKPSKPSSTTTSQTVGTEVTSLSLVGGSSSLGNSQSVA